MPSPINRLFSSLHNRTSNAPDAKVLGPFMAILQSNNGLSIEQKLSTAKKRMTPAQKNEITLLLQDATIKAGLGDVAVNFLSALVGVSALRLDSVDPVDGVARSAASNPTKIAVAKFKDIMKSGQLKKYYDAAIDATDDPALKAEAMKLFSALPAIKPGISAKDLVQAGLWTAAPRGIEVMQKSARYLPGRQVLVETNVFAKVPDRSDPNYESDRRKIGSYDKNGPVAVTYRATLVGEDQNNPKNFLVRVDGSDKPISVAKSTIYKHNQPHKLNDRHIQGDKRSLPYNGATWNIDYNSPLAKAKLCEIAAEMDDLVAELDFTKAKTQAAGGAIGALFGSSSPRTMVSIQEDLNKIIFSSIDMKYPKSTPFTDPGRAPQGTRDAARQAIRGTGMCVQQSSVYGALLMPFSDILGIDGQYRSGKNFRYINGATDNVFARGSQSGHGWWQITMRPSMKMSITDRTWNAVNQPLDRGYGFPYGDRYANRNISGYEATAVTDSDVNVSGDVTVATFERQFSEVGDGRENHISNRG